MTIGGNEKNATTKLEKHLDDVWAAFFLFFFFWGVGEREGEHKFSAVASL